MRLQTLPFRFLFPDYLAKTSFQRIPENSGIVLMYHEVLPDEVTLPAWTIVRESEFQWQMQYLARYFYILSMDQAIERLNGKQRGQRPFAVITFDDGYKGNFSTVLPIMESLGLPFVLYVATRAIMENSLYWYDQVISLLTGKKDIEVVVEVQEMPCSERFYIPGKATDKRRWKEMDRLLSRLKELPASVRESIVQKLAEKHALKDISIKMLSAGELSRLAESELVTIGGHTHSHELLDQLSPKVVSQTLLESNAIIRELTGAIPRHFSYPNGNYNQQVMQQVQKAGYKTAVTTQKGIWSKSEGLWEIPRVGIGRFDSKARFKALISGWV